MCGYRFEFKTCTECDTQNDITARHCWHCNHELVDPNDKLSRKASLGAVQNLAELPVIQTVLMPHKKDGKTLLRADYTVKTDTSTMIVSEYFHEQHESPFVVMKYKQFIKDIGADGCISDVLCRDDYSGPEMVTLKRNGKYYNVAKRHIGQPTPVTVHKKGQFQWT